MHQLLHVVRCSLHTACKPDHSRTNLPHTLSPLLYLQPRQSTILRLCAVHSLSPACPAAHASSYHNNHEAATPHPRSSFWPPPPQYTPYYKPLPHSAITPCIWQGPAPSGKQAARAVAVSPACCSRVLGLAWAHALARQRTQSRAGGGGAGASASSASPSFACQAPA